MPDQTLLPLNASEFERALEQSTQRGAEIQVPIHDQWNPWTCPAQLLPWLAWALQVDWWRSHWTEERKRQVIAAAMDVHITRGTLGALERALDALGLDITVLEWFEYPVEPGPPYHFQVEVDLTDSEIEDDTEQTITAIVDRYKPLRSRLDDVVLFQPVVGTSYLGVGIATSDDIMIEEEA